MELDFPPIHLARRINDEMPAHMLELVEDTLTEAGQSLAEARVTILGVAYLENVVEAAPTPAGDRGRPERL